ncbi:hypothetical protein M513_06321 [Trichuris suis]|nr:hypothetical protein M513_06321 [Trichuris suis]
MEAPFAGKVFDVKLIPEFDGSSQPVLEWLEKLELVCELCGIVDIARVLPLRLTGGALAVYQQLANEDRKDVGRIKEALTAAFAVDRFAAHRQFASRRLNMGESPDVFLADLRRLGTLAGGVSESFLGCAFVAGLPEYVQDLLRAGARMEEHTLNQLVGAGPGSHGERNLYLREERWPGGRSSRGVFENCKSKACDTVLCLRRSESLR